MRKYVTCTIALSLAIAGNAHAELITNGGFETYSFDGWTQWGDPHGTFIGATAHSGSHAAWFGPTNNFGGIRQTLAVNANQTVSLSFWISNNSTPANAIQVKFDGVTLLATSGHSPFAYTQYTFEHTVTNANPVLEFGFFHIPGYFRLDDVSAMIIAPLPPAAYAGFIGLAVAGVMTRSRRR